MSQKAALLGDTADESDVTNAVRTITSVPPEAEHVQNEHPDTTDAPDEKSAQISSHHTTTTTTENKPFQKIEPTKHTSAAREILRLGWCGKSRDPRRTQTRPRSGTANRRGHIFKSLFRLTAVLHLVLPSVLPTVALSAILLYGVRQAVLVAAVQPVNGTVLDPVFLAFLLSSAAFDFLIFPIRYMTSRHWIRIVPPFVALLLTTSVTWVGYALIVSLYAYTTGPRWSVVALMVVSHFLGAFTRHVVLECLWKGDHARAGSNSNTSTRYFVSKALLAAIGLTSLVYLGMTYNSVIFYIGNQFGPDTWGYDAVLVGIALPVLKGSIHFVMMRCLSRSFLSASNKNFGITVRKLRLYTGSVLISHVYLSLPIRILILRTQTDAAWIVSLCCMLVVEEFNRTILMKYEYRYRKATVLPLERGEEEEEAVEEEGEGKNSIKSGSGREKNGAEGSEDGLVPVAVGSEPKERTTSSSSRCPPTNHLLPRESFSLADVPVSLTPSALLAHLRTYAMIAVYVAQFLAFLVLAYFVTGSSSGAVDQVRGQTSIEVTVYRAVLGVFIELVTDTFTMLFREPLELDYRKIVHVKWHTHFELVGIAAAVVGALIVTNAPSGLGIFE